MLKKTMVIAILCFSMMALLQTQAMAYTFGSGGFGTKCYKVFYIIMGGQKPGTATTYVGTHASIKEAAVVCVNPGTNQRDVRQGKGGIEFDIFTDLANSIQMDDRGKFELNTDPICAKVGEKVNKTCDTTTSSNCTCDYSTTPPICTYPYECTDVDLYDTYQVSQADCKINWLIDEVLIQKLNFTGTIYKDCTGVDSIGVPTGCSSIDDEATYYCETHQDILTPWPWDGSVTFLCGEGGSPIAWDDYYSVRSGKTLKVNAPGVLGNDTDPEGNPITAIPSDSLISSGYKSVNGGTVELNADGGFKYTPAAGFNGVDSFKYKAQDSQGHMSNEANVIITVN
jgi:hypothetical protein